MKSFWQAPVLIVDDSQEYVHVLTWMLRGGFGFTDITASTTPAEAYALIEADPSRFGLLLIDYTFPGGETGAELLRKLSGNGWLTGKAVLLITADPSLERLQETQAVGAMGLVVKPVDRAQLEEQLKKAEQLLRFNEGESF